MSDPKYWLGFNLVRGIGPRRMERICAHFSDLEDAWNASAQDLMASGLDARSVERIIAIRSTLDLDREMAQVRALDIGLITLDQPKYPPYLREIKYPPPLLYVKGEILESDQFALAVVGTRRLSSYGRQTTERLVHDAVHAGFTIVSGLALGIDALAHKVALAEGGRTIAVMGCGLDTVYPPENRSLARDIVRNGQGAIVSDYPLGTQPEAKNFPPRNRIISGLSLGVLVIEASLKSGAMVTAEFAKEQDREVYSVPGNITSPNSSGNNALIHRGATLVTSFDDIMSDLSLKPTTPPPPRDKNEAPLTIEQATLMMYLSNEPIHVDELSATADLPIAQVSAELFAMEMQGLVKAVAPMMFVIGREPGPDYDLGV
jgi:DNA processing protein